MTFKMYDTTTTKIVQDDYSKLEWIWRNYDGSGNNLYEPQYGNNHRILLRKSPADFTGTVAVRGVSNPNPRLISNEICKGPCVLSSRNMSDMTWIWGQFIDHTLDLTEAQSGGETLDLSTDDGGPNEDFPGKTITFNRSKFTLVDGVREQENVLNSFLDGGNVYGFDLDRANALRMMDGSGKLKTGTSLNGEVILPKNSEGLDNETSNANTFFLAGDVRANENTHLTAMHSIWVREHNRICDQMILNDISYFGQDELIYQYARKMVVGMIQNITYNEFLPSLLGTFPAYTGYDPKVDSTIATEFSTVGFRLGHSMLSSQLQIGTNPANTETLRDLFFTPSYVDTNGINDLLIGASLKAQKEIDGIVEEDVRSFLFGDPNTTNILLDLAAINIQRGRDHGISTYNDVREAYGLSRVSSFSELYMPSSTITALESMYDTVDDIDPWVGMISEIHPDNCSVGELCCEILTEQFSRVRNGDRFWYENDVSLTEEDRETIGTTRLSDVLDRNISGFTFQRNVFFVE